MTPNILKRLAAVAAVALALTLATAGTASAQSCSTNPCTVGNNLSVSVPTMVTLTLSASNFGLTAPALGDFTAGVATITEATGPTLTVRSNKAYNLTVASAAATFTPGLGGAGYAKPAGDLEVKLGSGSYFALGTGSQTLVASGAKTNSSAQTLAYRTTYNFTLDTPDSYTLTIDYTLAAP